MKREGELLREGGRERGGGDKKGKPLHENNGSEVSKCRRKMTCKFRAMDTTMERRRMSRRE